MLEKKTSPLTKEQQKKLYIEICRLNDLTENILDIIENSHPVEDAPQEKQLQLTEPLINQMIESIDVLDAKYIEWLENGQQASKDDVEEVEGTIRKVFQRSGEFINKIREIPNKFGGKVKKIGKKVISVVEQIESDVLPRIGTGVGELIHGPSGVSYYEAMEEQAEYKKLLRAVKFAIDHFFRLTYYLLSLQNGLVKNPNNVIWGRTLPDIQAHALIEKHKKEMQDKNLDVHVKSYQELIKTPKGQGRGGRDDYS